VDAPRSSPGSGIQWLRWTLLVVLSGLGLVLLNHALFSFWVAGGPPGSFKLGWLRHAYASLGFAVATFFTAFGAFHALGRLPRPRLGSLVLLGLAAILFVTPFAVREVLIHRCVSTGGSWNHGGLECE
jgi:hypothetical protein